MSAWKFHLRHKVRIGPLFVWLTPRGFSSWGWKIGRWTRNVTNDTHSIDTPGPGGFKRRGRRR